MLASSTFSNHFMINASSTYCNVFSMLTSFASTEMSFVLFFLEIQGLFISKVLGLLHNIKYST